MDMEDLYFKIKLAKEAESFDEMASLVTEMMEKKSKPSYDDIELMSIAFKNSLMSRRKAWKILVTAETGSKEYQTLVRTELKSICDKILELINNRLIANATEIKSRVALLKLIADFNRYLAEVSETLEKQGYAENATVAYKEASELAVTELAPTDSLRLGTALNFSVFFYEILHDPIKAQAIAKEAYNEAVNELDNLTDETYQETITTMQLIRDNLLFWETDEK